MTAQSEFRDKHRILAAAEKAQKDIGRHARWFAAWVRYVESVAAAR